MKAKKFVKKIGNGTFDPFEATTVQWVYTQKKDKKSWYFKGISGDDVFLAMEDDFRSAMALQVEACGGDIKSIKFPALSIKELTTDENGDEVIRYVASPEGDDVECIPNPKAIWSRDSKGILKVEN